MRCGSLCERTFVFCDSRSSLSYRGTRGRGAGAGFCLTRSPVQTGRGYAAITCSPRVPSLSSDPALTLESSGVNCKGKKLSTACSRLVVMSSSEREYGAVSAASKVVKNKMKLVEESKQRNLDVIAGAQSLLSIIILGMACAVAFASRLFAVIRFESIIHEFDPWYGYLIT